jgi:hypothetical protein
MRIPAISILLLFTLTSLSQELKIGDFKSLPLDVSARENPVFDANGDACAIIKTRTGIQGIKFASDLEIKKIELRDGEYWLWVPPGTHIISIETSDFPKIEFTLPNYTEEFNVYIIYLSAILPGKTVYTPPRTVSFLTKPRKAEVYINNIFYGFTPVQINTPYDQFEYKLKKKKYLFMEGTDSIIDRPLLISRKLKRDPQAKGLFLLASSGVGFHENGIFWGMSIGKLGRTGGYFTLMARIPDKTLMFYELRSVLFVGGINQKIAKNFFLNLGIGSTNVSIPPETFVFNAGLILRTSNRLLLNFGATSIIWDPFHTKGFEYKFDELDINFGLGYNF